MIFLPKWRTLKHLACALLAALTFSCYGGHGDSYRTPEGSLQVFNDGNLTMRQLYVTPRGSSSWGVDQLAPSVLLPDDSITLTRLYPDYYDVKTYFSDGSTDEVFDVLIQDGVNTTIGMQNTGAVAVFNNSGLAINEIYLVPVSASSWGLNQTSQPLDPGQTLTLTRISPGSFDLEVILSNGRIADYLNFSVTYRATTTIQVN